MSDQVKQRIHILGKVFYSCPTLILASCFSRLHTKIWPFWV
ncbi:hypothetical protein HanPSC8_Chr09g0383791 [Helianthus annuus]|nr:hypothetical protein HanPSC8_Chr09g0383791 [Helianthus annuus]